MSGDSYDIVIVDGSAAGRVVESHLVEDTDASIALINAGDTNRDPFIHIPAGFAKIPAQDRHLWKYETVSPHGVKRAYRSGGTSSINAMGYVRGQIRDYAAWHGAVGDIGKWTYSDLLPVFMLQENDTYHNDFHGVDGGLAIQPPKGINRLNQFRSTYRARSAFRRFNLRSTIKGGAARSTLTCVRTFSDRVPPLAGKTSFASSLRTSEPLASSS
jgi:choline dehydrogenase